MRIAVCLSGYMRGMQSCLPTWQQYLLNPEHQFDFFICTGPTVEWCSVSRVDFHLNLLQMNVNVIDVMVSEPVPGPFAPILQKRNFNHRNIEHVLSMFDKIKKANQLKQAYEIEHNFKYDIEIRFRPDTYLKSEITFSEPDKWHVPKYGDFGGLNDQMCWSNSKNMNYYCSLYDNIVSYLKEDKQLTFNPEFLMKKHWEKSGCALQRPHVLYQLARDNTNMLPDNETRERIVVESNGTRNT